MLHHQATGPSPWMLFSYFSSVLLPCFTITLWLMVDPSYIPTVRSYEGLLKTICTTFFPPSPGCSNIQQHLRHQRPHFASRLSPSEPVLGSHYLYTQISHEKMGYKLHKWVNVWTPGMGIALAIWVLSLGIYCTIFTLFIPYFSIRRPRATYTDLFSFILCT